MAYYKIRLVCRKEKKALKKHPCKKTKWGRYIIDVLDSYYNNGGIGIGYYDGMEIFSCDDGFEHPRGDFYYHLTHDEKPLWSSDERAIDKMMAAERQMHTEIDSSNFDSIHKGFSSITDFFKF